MVKHGMDVQKQAIEYLNPGQIPFINPFALAEFVQQKFNYAWRFTYIEMTL